MRGFETFPDFFLTFFAGPAWQLIIVRIIVLKLYIKKLKHSLFVCYRIYIHSFTSDKELEVFNFSFLFISEPVDVIYK